MKRTFASAMLITLILGACGSAPNAPENVSADSANSSDANGAQILIERAVTHSVNAVDEAAAKVAAAGS